MRIGIIHYDVLDICNRNFSS